MESPEQVEAEQGSISSSLEWELEEGIPQVEDAFIQKYLQGRDALIEEEKKLRHDNIFKSTMSPMVAEASRIMSLIRRKELKEIWTKDFEEDLAERNGGNLYPGMMFTLARDRMEKTVLWQIIEKMPKGALLHAHIDAMMDVDWLIDQLFAEPGMHILSSVPLDSESARDASPFEFEYFSKSPHSPGVLWEASYNARSPVSIIRAAQSFPDGGEAGFRSWLMSRCTITTAESLCHHHGGDAIWRKFTSCFRIIDSIIAYEPIFRGAIRRLLKQLACDGIRYFEIRHVFRFRLRLKGRDVSQEGFEDFFRVISEEIDAFQSTEAGKNFYGARLIWSELRFLPNRDIVQGMKDCIEMKKTYPRLLSGFDFVGQEDRGRPLADLTTLIFWFRKRCVEEGVDIPFFFHAGETLGDGDSVDSNLYDALLLGTRRIGHGFSLFKHPLLIEMVKDKKVLIESCPISNEVLRLTSSILSHPLPALLARGVAVSLNNDDPAILGHGRNGLSHDFWQAYVGFENMGLEGLATMSRNSLKWSCFEDQKQSEWVQDITLEERGIGTKAQRLREWGVDFERFCEWVVREHALTVDDENEE